MSLPEMPESGNQPEETLFSEADFTELLRIGDVSEAARQSEQSLARVYDEIGRIEMLGGGSYHELPGEESLQTVLFLTRRQRHLIMNHTYFHIVVNDWQRPDNKPGRLITREFAAPRHYMAIGYSRKTTVLPEGRVRCRASNETGPILHRTGDTVDILTGSDHQLVWPELKRDPGESGYSANMLLADELLGILKRLNAYSYEAQVELARPLDKL